MAGILASSVSKTMTSGETAVDDAESGYVAGEQIALSTFPTGSSYTWGQAIPSGSTVAKSALSSKTAAAPAFTPDVAGEYVITADVDGTAYVIRLSVTASSPSAYTGSATFPPVTDASVPTPSTGITVYNSSDQGGMALKKPDGTVHTIDTTPV